jgi:acetolactate synthase I/III small subunit
MDALPDFVKLAEAYGHVGMRIERPEDVEPALREARALKDRTVFIDFQTDPTENVFPMVQAGKGITEMLLGSEDLSSTFRHSINFEESIVCQALRLPMQGEGNEKRNHMKHIIAVLLENEAGSLARVVGLFAARGYNIESLTVAPTEDKSLSRMTIVTTGSDDIIEQITKHLNRLIEVVKVVDLTEGAYTERELMMVKVRAVGKEREEMKRMADIFRGRVIDVTEKSYTIELTGDQGKNDAFLEAIDRSAILETVRTGCSGIGRGERILRV